MRPMVHALVAVLILALTAAPALAGGPMLSKIGGIKVGGEGTAEILSYDAGSKALYLVNAEETAIEVIDITDPTAPAKKQTISLTEYGAGINSVAVKKGLVAVAVESKPKQEPGTVVLMDLDGKVLHTVTVGALPDMLTFTPDGATLLVANEGEPSKDYSNDPEGTVSIIDVSKGAEAATMQSVTFNAYDAKKAELQGKGVRISHPKASVSQDLEPEYIAVSPDSKTAFIAMQENNALAVLDIASATITDIHGLGMKDWKGQGLKLDASDKDGKINMQSWPVFGLYMPDSIAAFEAAGTVYVVTANEGDSREYDGYEDEIRGAKVKFDTKVFADADMFTEANLGRLKMVKDQLDTNGDGLADRIVAFGGRSFTVWNGKTGELVFDSGDEIERTIAEKDPTFFNAEEEFDDRSDDKGAEPEGIAVGTVGGKTYAFVGLERQGGLMVYDVTEPAKAKMVQFINTLNRGVALDSPEAGDVAPEGVLFIAASDSPNGKPLVVTANEFSGTVAVFVME